MRRLFVLGCPRSGTTLLQGLLNTHPEITTLTESHFLDFGINRPKNGIFYYVLKAAPGLVEKFLADNQVDGDTQQELLKEIPGVPILPGTGVRKWTEFFISVIDRCAEYRGSRIWLEKTPDHLNRIRLIQNYTDNFHCIHIFRDGIDNVASLLKASKNWKRDYSVSRCVHYWNRAVDTSARLIDKPNHIFVSYESLVKSPQEIMDQLFTQLNLTSVQNISDQYTLSVKNIITREESWKQNNFKEIAQRSKSKQQFTPNERKEISRALDMSSFEILMGTSLKSSVQNK